MENKENRKKEIFGLIITIVSAIAICASFFLFFQPGVVSGSSMEPNYWGGDRFFITKDWCCGDYRYGDVVCVEVKDRVLIKRVIGLPGDTIEIKGGKVYRNGSEIDESAYLDPSVETTVNGGYMKVAVEEGELFVLGDNRSVSVDGRSFGTIKEVLGKTWFIYRKAWFD